MNNEEQKAQDFLDLFDQVQKLDMVVGCLVRTMPEESARLVLSALHEMLDKFPPISGIPVSGEHRVLRETLQFIEGHRANPGTGGMTELSQ